MLDNEGTEGNKIVDLPCLFQDHLRNNFYFLKIKFTVEKLMWLAYRFEKKCINK